MLINKLLTKISQNTKVKNKFIIKNYLKTKNQKFEFMIIIDF